MSSNHDADILQALADVDKHTRAGIVAELEAMRPGLDAALEDASGQLALAYKALETAKSQLSVVDSSIMDFVASAEDWRMRMDDPEDLENSITATFYWQGFQDHIAKLRNQRTQMQDAMRSVQEDHEAAQQCQASATQELQDLDLNLQFPYMGLGVETSTYKAYRVGSWGLWLAMLQGISPFEQEAFFAGLDEIAISTGYSTKHLTERMRQEDIAQAVAEAEALAKPDSAPSGAEIMADIHGKAMHDWTSTTREVVHRLPDQVKIPVTRNESFREVPGRRT